MKSLIARFKAAKTWQERAAIAEDSHPVTQFNTFFERADRAMRFAKQGAVGNAQRTAMELGAGFAETITKRDWQTLRDMADALAAWKRHVPEPDYVLIVIASMAGMFPPGWSKKWKITKLRKGTKDALTYADIIKMIERIDPNFCDRSPQADKKKIQRYAKQLGIILSK